MVFYTFSSVAQSCPALCDPMDCSTPGLPVHHQHPGFTQTHVWTSLVAQTVKHLPAMWETWVQSLGQEDPLEKETATYSGTLAWKIPWMEEPGRLQSMGSQRVGHDWVTSLSFFLFFHVHWVSDAIQPSHPSLPCPSLLSPSPPALNLCQHQGLFKRVFSSVQLLSHVRLCNPMNCSTPGLPVHHQLPEFTQTHVHWVSDAIQPSHPPSSPSPPAPNPSQHQGLFQ